MDNTNLNRARLDRRFLTTAIPYVNAAPHIGFALETVQADTLARFYRLFGSEVRFLAGSDENSIKNVQAAEAAGVPIEEFVEKNANRFLSLKDSLGLSYDDFIRTSSDPRHRPGAEKLWKSCLQAGDLYKRTYSGLYCVGCEQFYKSDELLEGKCPEHGTFPELVEEENWFFRLSRYESALRKIYDERAIEIVPSSRRNEILGWIEGGLEDFSVSRSSSRARGWGIPVPGDASQVIYVWFDALANYITALGYAREDSSFKEYWTNAQSREHVIGKGITRFHAIYWPAILLSAGLELPTRILIHGYVTVEGRKIGKSAGNAIDPNPLAEELGADALRYYLLRHIRTTGDGDFSHERFRQCYESELAGQLGNLVHRVFSMIERYCDGVIQHVDRSSIESDSLFRSTSNLYSTVVECVAEFSLDRTLDAIWMVIAEANRYVSEKEPWALAKAVSASETDNPESEKALHAVLYNLAASIYGIGICLTPFMPLVSESLLKKFDSIEPSFDRRSLLSLAGVTISAGAPLFPRS
ncbi:methionine--tRNA ligase [Rhizobium sp. ZPR3]|uniref:Methionine--tRNA ligase n=2 Tax=unclassified Rhizobium TaxID=2613769 RepID=A0AAU7SS10_9HYPH